MNKSDISTYHRLEPWHQWHPLCSNVDLKSLPFQFVKRVCSNPVSPPPMMKVDHEEDIRDHAL